MGSSKQRRKSAQKAVPIANVSPILKGKRAALWLAGRICLVIALCLAAYLAWNSLNGNRIAGCGPDSGCDEVLKSRWAYSFGIPVSVVAVFVYAGMIALSFRSPSEFNTPGPSWLRTSLATGGFTILGAAIWFVGVQAMAIGRFCPFCCTTHLLASAGSLCLLVSAFGGMPGWLKAPGAMAVGALGVAILGQWVNSPRMYSVTGIGSPSRGMTELLTNAVDKTTTSAPVIVKAEIPKPAPPPPPTLSLHSNRFVLNLADVPLIGDPGAPKVMVSLFDYTCKYCRTAHLAISEAQKSFRDQLAVVALPMPLDGQCNPWVRQTQAAHSNACEIARFSLAVWRADPAKFKEFDDWVMSTPQGLRPEMVRAKAVELVPIDQLNKAIVDPWVEKTLNLSFALYRANWEAGGSSAMPMLMIGTNLVAGALRNPEEIYRLLESGLALRREAPKPAGSPVHNP